MTRSTGTPATRAARALSPTAYTQRPNTVERIRTVAAPVTAAPSQIVIGIPNIGLASKTERKELGICEMLNEFVNQTADALQYTTACPLYQPSRCSAAPR